MQHNCDVVHIMDFCIGHGVQWPTMIEVVPHMHKTLKMTSIKCDGGVLNVFLVPQILKKPECISMSMSNIMI